MGKGHQHVSQAPGQHLGGPQGLILQPPMLATMGLSFHPDLLGGWGGELGTLQQQNSSLSGSEERGDTGLHSITSQGPDTG